MQRINQKSHKTFSWTISPSIRRSSTLFEIGLISLMIILIISPRLDLLYGFKKILFIFWSFEEEFASKLIFSNDLILWSIHSSSKNSFSQIEILALYVIVAQAIVNFNDKIRKLHAVFISEFWHSTQDKHTINHYYWFFNCNYLLASS